jgi:hypothetical protein
MSETLPLMGWDEAMLSREILASLAGERESLSPHELSFLAQGRKAFLRRRISTVPIGALRRALRPHWPNVWTWEDDCLLFLWRRMYALRMAQWLPWQRSACQRQCAGGGSWCWATRPTLWQWYGAKRTFSSRPQDVSTPFGWTASVGCMSFGFLKHPKHSGKAAGLMCLIAKRNKKI